MHMRVHDKVPQIDGNDTLVSSDGEMSCLENSDCDEELSCTVITEDEKDVEVIDHVKREDVEQILISNVASSCLTRLKPEDVEKDLVNKLSKIGANVISFKHRRDQHGDFKFGLAHITPINLQLIWGRRLNVDHCSIMHYNPIF